MIPTLETPPGASQFERVAALIQRLYAIVDELESLSRAYSRQGSV